MTATSTSRASYMTHVLDGKATTQRERVLACVRKHGPVSRRQIKEMTDLEINAVTGRVNSLLKDGQVKVVFEKLDKRTDRVVEMLMATPKQVRMF